MHCFVYVLSIGNYTIGDLTFLGFSIDVVGVRM